MFVSRMHKHARQGGDLIVRANTILRADVAQEVDSRGSDRVLFGESFNVWGRRRTRKAARVATSLTGESYDTIADTSGRCRG